MQSLLLWQQEHEMLKVYEEERRHGTMSSLQEDGRATRVGILLYWTPHGAQEPAAAFVTSHCKSGEAVHTGA